MDCHAAWVYDSTVNLALTADDQRTPKPSSRNCRGLGAEPARHRRHTPDLLGIYPGMPSAAAQAQLQKHSDSVNVQPSATGFALAFPDPKNRDQITVYLTQPPNDPPAVWMIQRPGV